MGGGGRGRAWFLQVGSSCASIPPPFGKNSAPYVKAFNQRLFEERFEEGKSLKANQAKRTASRNSKSQSSVKFSPLEAYRRHLEENNPASLARALAFGNASVLPGASIGERPLPRRRRAMKRDSEPLFQH